MSKDTASVHFKIEPRLKARFNTLPWGTRAAALRTMVSWLCDMYEQHGEIGVGAIIAGEFQITSDRIVQKVGT